MNRLILAGSNEVFHLHLLKLAGAKDEVPRSDFVPKRFSDLCDTKRQFAPAGSEHIREVNKYALGRFRSQVNQRIRIVFCRRAYVSLEHQVERAWLSQICRSAVWTFTIVQLVRAQTGVAFATVNQRIAEGVFVSGIFPDQPVQNDRRVEPFDVITLIDHPAPPRLLYVIRELDSHGTVIPCAAETSVKFG